MRKILVLIITGILCAMLLAAGCTSSPATTPATPATTPAAPPAATSSATTPATFETPAVTTAVAEKNITAAATTAAPVPAAASWNGTWNTSYSVKDSADAIEILTLKQNGASVTGTYAHGNGTVTANVQENRITGTWNETDDKGVYAGFFVFEKASDDKSFRGLWVNTPEGKDGLKNTTQYWNGVRV